MFRLVRCSAALTLACAAAISSAFVDVRSDRFGYTGTAWRFNSLADAQAFRAGGSVSPVEQISIGDRDLALLFQGNGPSSSNGFVFMGSWWYTTQCDANGVPLGRGWGNTRGNTGTGFTQLYDMGGVAGLSTQSFSAGWSNWLGSYYDTFSLSLTGANAGPAAFARFTFTTSNVGDGGIWLDYSLNMTVTGLMGQYSSGLIVDEIDHLNADRPLGVSGSFAGIFQNTSTSVPGNNGFYVFDLSLTTVNWAYDNRDQLAIDPFTNSYFATAVPGDPVPEPFTLGLVGAAALAALRRRRKNSA